MPAPTPEEQILAPRNPSVANSDDWPEFELTNVFIHAPDDETACRSLLDANEFNPLTVVGQLEPLPPDLAYLSLKPSSLKRTERIEITEVRTIAYGQYADRSIALWAAGKAGWFSVKPGRAYRKMFAHMSAAVELWYTIVDAYADPQFIAKNKSRQLTMDDRFELFLSHSKVERDTLHEHLDFLLSSMVAGKEGVAWESNPVYITLKSQYPEQHNTIASRIRGAVQKGKKGKALGRQGSVSSETSSMKRERGKKQNFRAKMTDVVNLDLSDSSGKASSSQPSQRSTSTRSGRVRNRAQSSSLPVESGNSRNQALNTPVRDDHYEQRRRAHKGKSSLRPRPSAANKAASRGGGKTVALDETDDSDTSPLSSPVPGKRKREDEEDTAPQPQHLSHRQRLREQQMLPPEDEGIDIPSSPGSVESSIEVKDIESFQEPIKSPREVLHKPDPIQEDTWTCALDGCTHKVFCASLPTSQRLIREHYALHAYDDDERVRMVKNLQAPSLPAQHLMERVRLQAKSDGFPGSRTTGRMGPAGDRFPTITARPVMQRY